MVEQIVERKDVARLSALRLKTTRDQPRIPVGAYQSPSMCSLSPEIARISTRSYDRGMHPLREEVVPGAEPSDIPL